MAGGRVDVLLLNARSWHTPPCFGDVTSAWVDTEIYHVTPCIFQQGEKHNKNAINSRYSKITSLIFRTHRGDFYIFFYHSLNHMHRTITEQALAYHLLVHTIMRTILPWFLLKRCRAAYDGTVGRLYWRIHFNS